jgi:hypothetical protein
MNNSELELNKEYPPADEPADIQRMAALIQAIHHPQKDGRVLRAQHAKDTGCVKAQFIVEPGLPDEYHYGVFREPRTYDVDDVVVRFSNASEFAESDALGTPRGMAIKILHADGERAIKGDGESTQDFLIVDSPAFIFRAVKDYTALFALRRRLKNDFLALLAFAPLHPRQAVNVLKAKNHKISGSLLQQYWSMAPFRLGPRAVKFTAKPQDANLRSIPPEGSEDAENFLFQKLARYLQGNDAAFDFMVQFQTDPVRTPIEDASVEWKESDSSFRKVATVRIPAQDLGSEEMRAFRASCENLSFNPWHTLADHLPLGGLNRLRRVAYEASVQRRRQKPS